ncbi:hypothetical protein BDR06DRAFT_643676 [Suillus hirtellus]|nr:hypothetical protein BDR06DRAFT_643676 [Suillus hirtellus]
MILTFSTILMAPNCLSLPHSFTGIVRLRLAGSYLASCTCACAVFSAEKVTELIWLPRLCACHRSVFPRQCRDIAISGMLIIAMLNDILLEIH